MAQEVLHASPVSSSSSRQPPWTTVSLKNPAGEQAPWRRHKASSHEVELGDGFMQDEDPDENMGVEDEEHWWEFLGDTMWQDKNNKQYEIKWERRGLHVLLTHPPTSIRRHR